MNHRSRVYVDVRQYYENADYKLIATKKGLLIALEEYWQLKQLIPEIDKAISELKWLKHVNYEY